MCRPTKPGAQGPQHESGSEGRVCVWPHVPPAAQTCILGKQSNWAALCSGSVTPREACVHVCTIMKWDDTTDRTLWLGDLNGSRDSHG